MTNQYLIGIDLGTPSTKSVVVDLEGNELGSASQEVALDTPKAGHPIGRNHGK